MAPTIEQERARLRKVFAQLEKTDIKGALLGVRPKVGSELQRVVNTKGAAAGESWLRLSPKYAARKRRLGRLRMGIMTGKMYRGLGRPTGRVEKSKKLGASVVFTPSAKHTKYFATTRPLGVTEELRLNVYDAIEVAVAKSFDRMGAI